MDPKPQPVIAYALTPSGKRAYAEAYRAEFARLKASKRETGNG